MGTTFARTGAIAITYDMIGRGESTQLNHNDKYVLGLQLWNSIRVIDFALTLDEAYPTRIGVSGEFSGGGTQTFLLTAVDNRVTVSAPVVMVSAWDSGGCNCEIGMNICRGKGFSTNNAEIAAMAAPRPMPLVSDGHDWTFETPSSEYPFIQRIYQFYGKKEVVQNIHLPNEFHDFGLSKREAVYHFAEHLRLNIQNVISINGTIDESSIIIEPASDLYAYDARSSFTEECSIGQDAVLNQLYTLQ